MHNSKRLTNHCLVQSLGAACQHAERGWDALNCCNTEKLARQAIVFIFFQYLGGQNTGFLLLNMIQETLKILLQLDLFQFSPP